MLVREYKNECIIKAAGPYALHQMAVEMAKKFKEGWVLDPGGKQTHIFKMMGAYDYQVILVKAGTEAAEPPPPPAPKESEVVKRINNTTKKDPLLEIAKELEIEIPDNIKHPTAIQKYLREVAIENEL